MLRGEFQFRSARKPSQERCGAARVIEFAATIELMDAREFLNILELVKAGKLAPGQALGTYEESLLVRDYATAHNLKRLLIVTSGYHSRRALWSMRRACEGSGIEVGIDSAPTGWQTPSPWAWWRKRWGWKIVGGEYVKMIYYWTKY